MNPVFAVQKLVGGNPIATAFGKLKGFGAWVAYLIIGLLIYAAMVVFSPGYFPKLVLELEGTGPKTVLVEWNSGDGFNPRETRRLDLIAGVQASGQISLPQRSLAEILISSNDNAAMNLSRASLRQVPPDKAAVGDVIWSQTLTPDKQTIDLKGPFNKAQSHPLLTSYRMAAATVLTLFLFVGVTGARRWLAGETPKQKLIALALLLIPAVVLFGWVLGQWPGYPTGDTYDQLNERVNLQFSNWNPFIHTIILNAFYDVGGTIGTISAIQAGASAWLAAFGVYGLWRRGCPLPLAFLIVVLFAFSPVVGIYALQPWRDILFCLATVFWMMWIFQRALDFKHRGSAAPLDWASLFALGLMLFLVSSVRHNGLVFMAVLPSLMFLLGAAKLRETLSVFCVAALALVMAYGPMAQALDAHKNTNYDQTAFSVMIQPVAAIVLNPYGFRSDNKERDLKAVEGVIDLKALRENYNPLSVVPLIPLRKNNPVGSQAAREFADAHKRLVLNNLPVFLGERMHLFASSIGFNTWGFASGLATPLDQQNDAFIERTLNFRHWQAAPLVQAFADWQKPIVASVWRGPGWTDRFVLWFTAVPGFVLLAGVLAVARWLPLSAAASLVVLVQVLAIAATSLASDFRYYYFLNLYPFFIVPMLVTEFLAQRRHAKSSLKIATKLSTFTAGR